jgi:acetyl-CoA acyltransferase 1
VPVTTKVKDPKTGEERTVTISVDDGVRASTTLEQLGSLKAAFKKEGGSTTAGNASQVTLTAKIFVKTIKTLRSTC